MSKIGKFEWIIVYVVAGIIDLAQFLIGIFEVPLSAIAIGLALIAINEAADPFIGGFAIIYFQIRGISMIKHPNRIISLLGVVAIAEFSGGIASLWIADVWYIRRDVKKDEAQAQSAKEKMDATESSNGRFNSEGMRMPPPRIPVYNGQTRLPAGRR